MLRQILRPALIGSRALMRPLVVARTCSTRSWEPYFDPEELKDVVGNKETEHFSFDHKKGILQEEEDERENFERYVDKWGPARFSNIAYDIEHRDFTVSKDPKEWAFVERLLAPELIPQIPVKEHYPSGYQPPRIKPDSEEVSKLGYFVSRTSNHLLPVYVRYDRARDQVVTSINRCDGNMFKLRDDLDKFLEDRYKMKFNSRVAELYNKIFYMGDFEVDFKEFLLAKGF